MRFIRFAAMLSGVLVLAWSMAWTWYWSGWDMLSYDLYARYVFRGDPVATAAAEFDTTIGVCLLLAVLLTWCFTRLRRRVTQPGTAPPSAATAP